MMDYENYMELYEAVYFFSKINITNDDKMPLDLGEVGYEKLGIHSNVYHATMRILHVNNLIDFKEVYYILTPEQKDKHQHLLENIIQKSKKSHFESMYDKALKKNHFFFNHINDLEYEIYSRCNFAVTFETGKSVASLMDFSNKSILELGGNSGGFASAIVSTYKDANYTVVDTEIPCRIGNEFKMGNALNINFVEGDVFKPSHLLDVYDYLVIMNLLHDFDDASCLEIIKNYVAHSNDSTKFLIIEDILTQPFEPKEVVMHGLRLAVECRGGKQRTLDDFQRMFSTIGYRIEKGYKINSVHSMLIFTK